MTCVELERELREKEIMSMEEIEAIDQSRVTDWDAVVNREDIASSTRFSWVPYDNEEEEKEEKEEKREERREERRQERRQGDEEGNRAVAK